MYEVHLQNKWFILVEKSIKLLVKVILSVVRH